MNMLHIGAFNSTNAGDTVLLNATHRLWEKMVGEIDWVRMSVWSVVDKGALEWINETDGVVIGAGGLLLRDSRPNIHTGWQWNCPISILNKINVPIYVFGIGYNRFRGQTDFPSVFSRHISLLVEKAKFFSGGATGDPNDIVSYQGSNAARAGFGIGMGLGYENLVEN
jgi:polysaccharide pyruvyl transferase WcaK-like protein